ncbi:MAG: glycosyltransferase, partial [Acidimicrobiales bacterium]
MRVGIDYRILTVGPSAATRGMPRYTQQQLREVLARGGDDEYVLLCDPRTDRSLILPETRNAPNVRIRLVPEEATVDVHHDPTMLAKAEVFESWLASLDLDVYHATTPFYLDQLLVAQHDACPYVATVYDLIPLIYPSQYLATPKLRQLYTLAATMVSRADRILAISQAARSDASRYLGVPMDRIDVAAPIAEPFFRPLPEARVEADLAALRARLGIHGSFVLSVSDLHFTKNLETLLRGYALLPAGVRDRLPLVVACHLSKEHAAYLSALAERLGVAGRVFTTGLVSDAELAALYNGAEFVVHPSRFEGFGLPVLEAMQCGTPVIATTSAAVPEVAGDAAVLVDPDDAPAFAQAMEALAEDPARRQEMRELGLARAATFSGPALASATVAGYEATARGPAGRARPRLAVWSPLSPLQSGIADYTGQLVGPLNAVCDVELFVDDGYLPELDLLVTHPVRNFRAFDRLSAGYDAVVFQLGASVFHLYMEAAARRFGGIVVLHDLVWSHLLHHARAERGDIDGFRSELLRLEGPEALAEYDALDRSDPVGWGARLREFLDRHLMLGDVVSSSRAQIVHFPAGVDELARRYPDANPAYVPMGVPDPGPGRPEVHAARARRRLGIDPSPFVVGVFGVVDEVKRVEVAVQALVGVVATHPDTLLLVVGPVLDPAYRDRVLALAEELGVDHLVRLTGHVSAGTFADHLAAVDVVVNLRWPSKKQMSATVLRAAAAGKPVVLSDLPEWGFLPDTFCRRVPAGDSANEVDALAAHLVELAGDPALRARLSTGAHEYHRAEATPARMAAAYLDVLQRIPGRRPEVPPRTVRRSTPDVNLNKVCEIEDFSDPDLAAVLRDVFSYKLAHVAPGYPVGSEYRKDWEIAMAVRALRDGGALRPDAVILGVGAGCEDTAFYLTRHVARVVATDRYLSPEEWSEVAPSAMLVDPASLAPYDFDQSRLVVQHMDGRLLRFDDDTFDGIFSSGSIEHFGDLEDIASAAYEMGRVLKPGGVLSVSTEILLSGPPGGKGMPGTVLFSPADLRRYVIEASGLEPVDDVRLEVSQPTLTSQRDLARAIRDRRARVGGDHGGGSWPGDPGLDLPHLIVVSDGYVFGSVHLALRKGEPYPATPNGWARPSAAVRRAVEEDNRRLVYASPRPPAVPTATNGNGAHAPAAPALPSGWDELQNLAGRLPGEAGWRQQRLTDGAARIVAVHGEIDASVAHLRYQEALAAGSATELGNILAGVATLPERLAELAFDAPSPGSRAPSGAHGTGWRWCPVILPNGTAFGVMVDPAMADGITEALVAGGGAIDWTTVLLMLDMVRPGDVVLDLGAYLGTFTLAAAAAG